MENNETALSKLMEIAGAVTTGVPPEVSKNFIKAFGQLCNATVGIPIAWLEGKSAEIRAEADARVQIIKKQGEIISEQIKVSPDFVDRASNKFASKVIKEQINLDQITLNAASEINNKKTIEHSKNSENKEISEDWLNEFENLARLKSSDDMKLAFGKILAGEIIKPGTFSIKTIKLISQLDNQAARLFQLFCSQTISLRNKDIIIDARVVSFSGNAASNSLLEFGLSFDALNILNEYGLIISDYNSWMDYSYSIVDEQNQVNFSLWFQNKHYGLVPSDKDKYDKTLKLFGVALSKAGKELLEIIPLSPSENYKKALFEFTKSKYLDLVEIKDF